VKRILFLRRQMARLLLSIYIIGTFLPSTIASAQTMFFSRPGPGVSRLPLNVMAFGAPGFGDVSDAINLATGNVYLEMSGMSRNTNPGTAFTLFGGNWNSTERVRLTGFNAGLRPGGAVPSSFTVAVGDNSTQSFTRLASAPTDAPSWIKRYAAITSNIYYYNNQSQNGTQFSQEWVVLRVREYTDPTTGVTTGNTIAHYYLNDGFRYSFSFDGEYADYSQTLYQQYQGAKANDPEGEVTVFRTNYSYLANQDGRIRRVTDMFGRATTYVWDYGTAEGGDGNESTLDQINYLVTDVDNNGTIDYRDNSSYAQRVNFTYASGKLTQVTYHTYDGVGSPTQPKGSPISRYVKFVYDPVKPVITEIRKNVFGYADVTKEIVTRYAYDSQNRVTQIRELTAGGVARTLDTNIDYSKTPAFSGGLTVVVRQGDSTSSERRETEYSFDTMSRMRKKRVWDFNPEAASGRWLEWQYAYNANGSTVQVIEPSGKSEHYAYDQKGNLTRIQTYDKPTQNPDALDDILEVRLTAPKTTIAGNETIQLTATIVGATTSPGVSWSVSSGEIDILSQNTIGNVSTVTYNPRNSASTVVITATSLGNSSKKATLTLTVQGLRVSITNPVASLNFGQTYTFNARVDNDAQNRGVTWSVTRGTITSTGVYTAPQKCVGLSCGFQLPYVTVTATSVSNPAVKAELLFCVQSVAGPCVAQTSPDHTLETETATAFRWMPLIQNRAHTLGTAVLMASPYFGNTARTFASILQNYTVTTVSMADASDKSTMLFGVNDWTRKQVFEYDADNRLVEETTYGKSGIYNGVSYDYTGQRYTYTSSSVVTVQNQTFTVPITIDKAQKLKETVWYTIRTTLNSDPALVKFGLTQKIERLATNNVAYGTTTYTYFDKGNQDVTILNTNGDPNGTYKVMHYGDQLQSQTTEGVTKNYRYDLYGGVSQKIEPSAYASGLTPGTIPIMMNPVLSGRYTYYTSDGFGNLRVETVQGDQVIVSKRFWSYYGTGELDYSWEGTQQNLTDYAYDDSGSANHGRLIQIRQGIDLNASRDITQNADTWREFTYFEYTGFGDASKKQVQRGTDNFIYAYKYDTLGRQIREERPDGGVTVNLFDTTGQVSRESVDGINWQTEHDALGRTTKVTYPDGNSVATTYDPFDRPLKIVDNRLLSMSDANEESRTSYLVYDSFGNLTMQVGPALRSAAFSTGYTDSRRPIQKYVYDLFGRQSEAWVYSSGVIDTKTFAVTNGVYGITKYSYNNLDRLTRTVDPDGYFSDAFYDASGNVWSKHKQVQTNGEIYTTYSSFDALGRQRQHRDARGFTKKMQYDLFGNVLSQEDERGIVTQVNGYTLDGLLLCTAEPDMNLATAATATSMTGCTAPGGYVLTKLYQYSNSPYPTDLYTSTQDTAASTTSAAKTSYTYNYAGQVLTTKLPAANTDNQPSTISQVYDRRGNLGDITDTNGFTTHYDYNFRNQVTHEWKQKRANNAVDNAALPSDDGLHTYYEYDAAGNLKRQIVGRDIVGVSREALVTDYVYNTMGKVIAESRPHTSAITTPLYKLSVYDLTGNLTAGTTYDYQGSLRGASNLMPGPDISVRPSVTDGNVTTYRYNNRGLVDREASISKTVADYENSYLYNGLGQRVQRIFTVPPRTPLQALTAPAIYANMRRLDGTSTDSPNYNTYWSYDKNGNLLESWDALPDDSTSKQNVYSYTYSATNKETRKNQTVIDRIRPLRENVNAALSNGVVLAASNAQLTTNYNERDLVSGTTARDEAVKDVSTIGTLAAPTGVVISRTTTYSYYADGNVSTKAQADGSTVTFEYDVRGRVKNTKDSNGQQIIYTTLIHESRTNFGPTETTTTYDSDGKTESTTMFRGTLDPYTNSAPINLGVLAQSITVPTVGGLVYQQTTLNNKLVKKTRADNGNNYLGPQNVDNSSATYVYNSRGALKTNTGKNNSWGNYTVVNSYGINGQLSTVARTASIVGQSLTDTYGYSSNGDVTSITAPAVSKSITYTLDSRGNRLSVGGTLNAYNPFFGYSKRYNADGRPAEYRYSSTAGDGFPKLYYTDFFYDPFGEQVLAAQGYFRQRNTGSEYWLARNYYTSVGSRGNVEVLRVLDPNGSSAGGGNESVKDESFTAADAASGHSWTLSAVQVFGVDELTDPLEAPVEALSTTLQIDPMEIVAPSDETPAMPSDEEITPPVEEAGEGSSAEAEGEEVTTAEASGTGITTLLEGDSLGSSPSNPVSSSAEPTETGLTAPSEGLLPESLATLDATDVQAPEGYSFDTGEVTEITEPNSDTSVPQVGTTAADSPTDIIMPEDIANADLPDVGDVPAPIETVIPPVGWSPEGNTVDGFTYEGDKAACGVKWNPNNNAPQYQQCLSDALDKENEKQLNDIANTTGGNSEEERANKIVDFVTFNVEENFGIDLTKFKETMKLFEPAQQIQYALTFYNATVAGRMDKKIWENLEAANDPYVGSSANGMSYIENGITALSGADPWIGATPQQEVMSVIMVVGIVMAGYVPALLGAGGTIDLAANGAIGAGMGTLEASMGLAPGTLLLYLNQNGANIYYSGGRIYYQLGTAAVPIGQLASEEAAAWWQANTVLGAANVPRGIAVGGNTASLEFERLARISQRYDVLRSSVPIKTTAGSGDIDLVLSDNGIIRLVEVGGAAKTTDGLGKQLTKLQIYAEQNGGVPTFFYDTNTPQNILDFATRKLGTGNVLPIPTKSW
jgi:YD repeat-containing protein